MFRDSRILVPTDFSHYANFALNYAVAIAKRYSGTLHVAHIVDSGVAAGVRGDGLWLSAGETENLLAAMREHAESRLASMAEAATMEGVTCETHIAVGNPSDEILQFQKELGCNLVVMSTHGRSGFEHLVFGSVAEKIVRRSPVPVLCIKHPEHEFVDTSEHSIRLDAILLPTDFSPFSQKALPFAVSMAKEFGSRLVLFHATEVPMVVPEFLPESALTLGPQLEQDARELMEKTRQSVNEVALETVVANGSPYREICDYVEKEAIDLVIIPTHGRSGLAHVLFGSVSERVVRLAKCPVMTIRPEWDGPEPL